MPLRSRAKYNCKPALAVLIAEANLLEKDFYFDLRVLVDDPDRFWIRWYEVFKGLPKSLVSYLFNSPEVYEYEIGDSIEYWENHDGAALDCLRDLLTNEEISETEYEQIASSSSSDVAEFLVDKGFRGRNYSWFRESQKQKKLFERDDEDARNQSTEIIIDFFASVQPAYIRTLERLQETRAFLIAITKIAERLNTSCIDQEATSRARVHSNSLGNFDRELNNMLQEDLRKEIFQSSLRISEDGILNFSISSLADAVQGIDISRLRRCDVCDDIFWAMRKDAFACSRQHAKRRQMRLLRQNWEQSGHIYRQARRKKRSKKER